jgi:hypothetical protein
MSEVRGNKGSLEPLPHTQIQSHLYTDVPPRSPTAAAPLSPPLRELREPIHGYVQSGRFSACAEGLAHPLAVRVRHELLELGAGLDEQRATHG